eukprot:6196341-Pleurochrysis_carterae.AAC.2
MHLVREQWPVAVRARSQGSQGLVCRACHLRGGSKSSSAHEWRAPGVRAARARRRVGRVGLALDQTSTKLRRNFDETRATTTCLKTE